LRNENCRWSRQKSWMDGGFREHAVNSQPKSVTRAWFFKQAKAFNTRRVKRRMFIRRGAKTKRGS